MQRLNGHASGDSEVGRELRLGPFRLEVLAGPMLACKARKLERQIIAERVAAGVDLLNAHRGGQTGSAARVWAPDRQLSLFG